MSPKSTSLDSLAVRLFVARWQSDAQNEAFRNHLTGLVGAWKINCPADIDGSILQISANTVFYWEHQTDSSSDKSLIDYLRPLVDEVFIDTYDSEVKVRPVFSFPDFGVECRYNTLMNVRVSLDQNYVPEVCRPAENSLQA